ncbi:unnamed protein product [Vitrella brassicaformis CCMP3155]|uniref:PITH domain-containing protein n=1 Tax=Vitrella brassicaformis (strain CCMP3155) TaxID=1169540 RepID=A0A0G4GXU1_VITBC|nr:unnamed protein product [Vitrella brassicaformis CCMP3155]|mmetsp:Transcript_17309/g.41588  ORF Transcript_17309/g.41588 Transcript_17309/m.41588 type:complete len:205 (-) Transcript_17309:198-812(-)|eukprot:CEM35675.1 unnamed protein product [Vitrella brassicaformis CCMP3155]
MPGLHGFGCNCKHESELRGGEFLLPYIDKEGVRGLNEEVANSAVKVFKTYEERLNDSEYCDSTDGDPELIIQIPFTAPCKISSLHVIGGTDGTSPSRIKLYTNREDIDFTNVHDIACTQEVELVEDYCGAVEYSLKVAKFQNVTHLTVFFDENFGANQTRLYYIGLRGQGSSYQRKAVVTVYEARAELQDHEIKDQEAPDYGVG